MTAPQDLARLATSLGMPKCTQEQLAAFVREVLAGQTCQSCGESGDVPVCAGCYDVLRAKDVEIERLNGEKDTWQMKALQRDLQVSMLSVECDRLRARLEATQQEARDNLERAERAEVRLKQVDEELGKAMQAIATARHADDNTRAFAVAFCETVGEAELRANTPKGGQSVPNNMDFAHVLPSTRGQLRWWAKCGRAALKGEVSALLVRARNEGLEKAAHHIVWRMTWVAHDKRWVLADEIAAMKEAEQ